MRSLDRCQQCEVGRMRTYKTRSIGFNRVRYLKCEFCKAKGREQFSIDAQGRPVFFSHQCTSGGNDESCSNGLFAASLTKT